MLLLYLDDFIKIDYQADISYDLELVISYEFMKECDIIYEYRYLVNMCDFRSMSENECMFIIS